MLSFLFGIVLSFLPKRYRERFPEFVRGNLRLGAVVSGLFQCLGCLGIFCVRYLIFLQRNVGALGDRVIAHGAEEALGATTVQAGMGYVSMVEYIFHPLPLLLIYFALEGAVRFCAAAITEEIVATLPLHIVAWAQDRVGKARAERALGPRVADIVEQVYSGDYDLRIFTCRPKRNWDRLITVSYEGQLYAVAGEQQGKPPYRCIYHLRKTETVPKKLKATDVSSHAETFRKRLKPGIGLNLAGRNYFILKAWMRQLCPLHREIASKAAKSRWKNRETP